MKIMFFLILVGSLASSGYFYWQYRKASGAAQAAEIKSLSDEIGKIMDLPSDETPTLATVTDKSKLESQPFFKKAENDDKVLIYVKAGKAILYRPSAKKIIEVSTVNIAGSEDAKQSTANTSEATSASQSTTQATQTEAHPTLALYNGAKTLGLTYKVEEQLGADFKNVAVTKKEPAAKNEYTQTVVVDVSGKHSQIVSDIAKKLSAEVKSLPDGEVKPDTDILVIVGEDKAE